MDQRGDYMKMNFDHFQIQNWMLQTGIVDEKNEVICLVSMFSSWAMVLKSSKKVHFLQFCADLSKKFKSVKATYVYASESSHYTLPENYYYYYYYFQMKILLTRQRKWEKSYKHIILIIVFYEWWTSIMIKIEIALNLNSLASLVS